VEQFKKKKNAWKLWSQKERKKNTPKNGKRGYWGWPNMGERWDSPFQHKGGKTPEKKRFRWLRRGHASAIRTRGGRGPLSGCESWTAKFDLPKQGKKKKRKKQQKQEVTVTGSSRSPSQRLGGEEGGYYESEEGRTTKTPKKRSAT